MFFGRFRQKTAVLTTVGDPPYRTGRHANKDFVENALSAIRDRDEFSLRVRYTFCPVGGRGRPSCVRSRRKSYDQA